ncbi:hypothetical protein [Cupriavidus sp. IDO]|uniref:hypothetical protein n=1 Tax=Cupriavidus sp. IDO TaxID=1539142 RepID=UPI000579601C|nr:hypothetical protein [Cupriavidus sp. IDO]KWR75715.1 hypothetical protein RM96_33880 [Cupriavidus sp. IDO]
MKKTILALPLALLAACASQQPAITGTVANADNSSGWQSLRAKYMDCVQREADKNLSGKAQSKDVAAAALAACQADLTAMHDSFRTYLDAEMSSAHGKASARQAADRVTNDTREKARNYLVRYVERERYVAKAQ